MLDDSFIPCLYLLYTSCLSSPWSLFTFRLRVTSRPSSAPSSSLSLHLSAPPTPPTAFMTQVGLRQRLLKPLPFVLLSWRSCLDSNNLTVFLTSSQKSSCWQTSTMARVSLLTPPPSLQQTF